MIKCSNTDCPSNTEHGKPGKFDFAFCKHQDIELEKTWAGSENQATLRCLSMNKEIKTDAN